MLILPNEIYDKYKNNNYKESEYFISYFNKCIKYSQPPINFIN